MPKEKIPVTINILTKNNASSIQKCLESVSHFNEILIADGGSTDGTRELCHEFGCKVVDQNKSYLDSNGNVKNFAGVRNSMVELSKNNWILCMDSDEQLHPDSLDIISAIVTGTKKCGKVLKFHRKYIVREKLIDHAVTYPNIQVRMFHKAYIQGFQNDIHEVMAPLLPEYLDLVDCVVLSPLPELQELKSKWRKYIEHIVHSRHKDMKINYKDWFRGTIIAYSLVHLRLVKYYLTYQLFGRGTKMPFDYELARFWYNFKTPKDITINIFKRELTRLFR